MGALSSFFVALALLLCCFDGGRAQCCEACEIYLHQVMRTITSSAGLDKQLEILLHQTCPNSGIPDCSSALGAFWPDLQLTLNNAEVVRGICINIDAGGNCIEWQVHNVTCSSCQARLRQFASIVHNNGAIKDHTQALMGSLYCEPKCRHNPDCLRRCSSFVEDFFPLAVKDLTPILTSNALETCRLIFNVC